MAGRLRAYLQLVRLPNLFTAAADPLAGWIFAGGAIPSGRIWGPLVASGVVTYAAGMVLNDLFDREDDHRERPGRPIPSGRVSLAVAGGLGWTLIAIAPVLAAFAGTTSLIVSLALVAAVLGYDLGLKRTPMGPQVMGACRGLNLLLGMSPMVDLGGASGWLAAGAFATFVAGVTWISRDEVHSGRRRGLIAGMVFQSFAVIALIAAGMAGYAARGDLPAPGINLFGQKIGPMLGVFILLLTGRFVGRADSRALSHPTPATLQAAVKTGVFALVWLDVGLVAAARGPILALPVAALWLPAFLIGRRLYAT